MDKKRTAQNAWHTERMGDAMRRGDKLAALKEAQAMHALRHSPGQHWSVTSTWCLGDFGQIVTLQHCEACGAHGVNGFSDEDPCKWIQALLKKMIVTPLIRRYVWARQIRQSWWKVKCHFDKWQVEIGF